MVCDLIATDKDEIVKHISRLIQFPSKQGEPEPGMPFGRAVGNALQYMLDLSGALGFRTVNLDGYCGYAEFGQGSETVCVASHLDVVPEGPGWSVLPFGGQIKDGRIYGRGAGDNKASAVVSLYGLKAIRDSGFVPKKKIRVLFGANEESGMADMRYYVAREGLPDLAFTPDAAYVITNGEKGLTRVEFTEGPAAQTAEPQPADRILSMQGGDAPNRVPDLCTAELGYYGASLTAAMKGIPAHGANPSAGVNAVMRMVELLRGHYDPKAGLLAFLHDKVADETDGALLGIKSSDNLFGALTVNIGILQYSGEKRSAIADIRYPLSISIEAIAAALEQSAEPYGVFVKINENMNPFYVDRDARIIRLLSKAHLESTGEAVHIATGAGGSYSKAFQGRCVLYGGIGVNGHGADEYVEIDKVMWHARLCTHAMFTLLAEGS
jgi:succinyl-diaminopimelate desuccinylase